MRYIEKTIGSPQEVHLVPLVDFALRLGVIKRRGMEGKIVYQHLR